MNPFNPEQFYVRTSDHGGRRAVALSTADGGETFVRRPLAVGLFGNLVYVDAAGTLAMTRADSLSSGFPALLEVSRPGASAWNSLALGDRTPYWAFASGDGEVIAYDWAHPEVALRVRTQDGEFVSELTSVAPGA